MKTPKAVLTVRRDDGTLCYGEIVPLSDDGHGVYSLRMPAEAMRVTKAGETVTVEATELIEDGEGW